jgi:hypothetical protein
VVRHEPDRINHGRTEFTRRATELLAERPGWAFRPMGTASELDGTPPQEAGPHLPVPQ